MCRCHLWITHWVQLNGCIACKYNNPLQLPHSFPAILCYWWISCVFINPKVLRTGFYKILWMSWSENPCPPLMFFPVFHQWWHVGQHLTNFGHFSAEGWIFSVRWLGLPSTNIYLHIKRQSKLDWVLGFLIPIKVSRLCLLSECYAQKLKHQNSTWNKDVWRDFSECVHCRCPGRVSL